MEDVRRQEAIAELIGAICYALLRSFQVAARGTTNAPTIGLAERQAAFAAEEFQRYRLLRARLSQLAEFPEEAMEVFRAPIDAFYESATADGWVQTQVFHYIGDTITTDFVEILTPKLDQETGADVRQALTGRTAQEAFALEQIEYVLRTEGEQGQANVAAFAGSMIGTALNRFRDALLASNTVEQVLGGPDGVKECVLEMLGRHRERLERLGVEQVDE